LRSRGTHVTGRAKLAHVAHLSVWRVNHGARQSATPTNMPTSRVSSPRPPPRPTTPPPPSAASADDNRAKPSSSRAASSSSSSPASPPTVPRPRPAAPPPPPDDDDDARLAAEAAYLYEERLVAGAVHDARFLSPSSRRALASELLSLVASAASPTPAGKSRRRSSLRASSQDAAKDEG